jgi:hypothetical protein
VSVVTPREAVSFAYDCAIRVLGVWESVLPADLRPRSALDAVRGWLAGRGSEEELNRTGKAAAGAGVEADDPATIPDLNPALAAAIHAADAASHAALTAERASQAERSAGDTDGTDVAACAAWTARFAMRAVSDPEPEQKWQTERLIAYLLGRA